MNTWKIYPIFHGIVQMASSAVYYKVDAREEGDVDVTFGAFACQCNETGEWVMIDCGICDEQDWQPFKDILNPASVAPGFPTFKDGLKKLNLDPAEIETVAITHLHADHCFNMPLFTKAKFYIQKDELQHAVTPTPSEYGSYQKRGEVPLWMRGNVWPRITPIDGDYELRDGIDLWKCSSHTPGSQIVVVQTKEGPYLICGDIFYTQEQYSMCRMLGNFTDLQGWFDTRERVRAYMEKHNGKLLMNHDISSFEREVIG